MIGRDEKMLIVFEWIRTAAKSDISVLILGPTGSGKEVVARMIHELSRRGTRELPGRQLRRAARHAVRVGNLRLREGRVHRRARSQARTRRAGRPRHAVPRRNRRPVARRAGQAAARARGSAVRAARRTEVGAGRFPPDLRDQPAARPVRPRQPFPRGPLLPRQRVLDPAALAARAADRHPRARQSVRRALLRGQRAAARREGVLARSAGAAATRIRGRATSASWRAPSRARRSRRRDESSATPTSSSCIRSPRRPPKRRRGCRRCAKPSARTSSACSRPRRGTRRKPRGCSRSAAARSIARSSSTVSSRTRGCRETEQRSKPHFGKTFARSCSTISRA